MTDSAGSPFRFFSLHVTRTRRISPSLVRVSFAGDDLRHFHSLGYDQSLSLFVPHPGQREPQVPIELGDGWWQGWRDLPADVRAVMRSYTLRELRRGPDEIDVDFVLHTPAGPASAWAERAVPGDRVVLLGPAVADNRAIRFRAPEDADLIILWGDATALPAIAAILEALPGTRRVRAWIEVDDVSDVIQLTTPPDTEINWLVGEDSLENLRTAVLPDAAFPYVWIAGESGSVKALRRHFVQERGIDRRRVTFVGYWRRGMSEEELRAAGE